MKRYLLHFVMMAVLLCGCAQGKPESTSQGQIIKGKEYLSSGDLKQAEAAMQKEVERDPTNAGVNFSYGRVLLATNKPRQALPYLKKAASLEPDNSLHLFWLGVAFGENKRPSQERASYERALQLDSNYVEALVYLGNNHLRAKAFQPALDCYQRALAIAPANPQALYNQAVIFKHLQRTPEEKLAWRLYLESYPSGELARRAADHLNLLDDFSYRNHPVGHRIMTLPAISFAPLSAELTVPAKAALDQIGAVVNRLKRGKLDILVYQKNNLKLAQERALSIKNYLDRQFTALQSEKRIRLSWFKAPEKRKLTGRVARIDESVVFFLTDPSTPPKTRSKKGTTKKTTN